MVRANSTTSSPAERTQRAPGARRRGLSRAGDDVQVQVEVAKNYNKRPTDDEPGPRSVPTRSGGMDGAGGDEMAGRMERIMIRDKGENQPLSQKAEMAKERETSGTGTGTEEEGGEKVEERRPSVIYYPLERAAEGMDEGKGGGREMEMERDF